MSWITAIFLATIVFSFCVILDKFITANHIKSVYSFAVILNIIYAPFIFITTYFQRNTFILGPGILYSAVAGVFWFFMWIFYWKALQKGEASRVSAVFFTLPIYSAIIGITFLHESLSLLKWVGIVVIVVGAILSSLGGASNKKDMMSAYLFALLAAVLAAIGNAVSKYAMSDLPPLTVNCIAFYSTIPLYLFLLKEKKVVEEVRATFRNTRLLFKFGTRGLVGYVGIMLNMTAIGLGPISLVSAIAGTQPIVVLIVSLGASIFFPKIIHEELGKKTLLPKFAALVLTVVGIAMVNL